MENGGISCGNDDDDNDDEDDDDDYSEQVCQK